MRNKKISRFLLTALALALAACSHSTNTITEGGIYKASQNLSSYMVSTINETSLKINDSGEDRDVFIVSAKDVASLSESDCLLAAEIAIDGKTVIVDSPSIHNIVEFGKRLDNVLSLKENEHIKALSDISPYSIYDLIRPMTCEEEALIEAGASKIALRGYGL